MTRHNPAAHACPNCDGIEHTEHCPTPETHNWGCGCPTDQLPGRRRQEAETILHDAMDEGVKDPAIRQKLIDQLTEACRHETYAAPALAVARAITGSQPEVITNTGSPMPDKEA